MEYPKLPLLSEETREAVPTKDAARYLDITPPAMREWAAKDIGPIKPLRFMRKLMWRADDIRRVLKGTL